MVRSHGTVTDGQDRDEGERSTAGIGSRPPSASVAHRPTRILVTIQHPAHVHFFRPIVRELEARGATVRVCARDKDLAVPLLDAADLDYQVLAGSRRSILGRAAVQAVYEGRLLRIARQFDPDVITAIGGVAAAHVAKVTGATSVLMSDSEPATLTNRLAMPFADVVCTPRWYGDSIDGEHVRYDGFHELAYLAPDRFTPDPAPLRAAGVDPESTYSVVRLVSWSAQHDVGESGFSATGLQLLVDTLATHGDVYVSAEGAIPAIEGIDPIPVAPADLHHLLAFADCYVGDSQTMATEAGLLGTPAVRYNSFVGEDDMGNFRELADAGLVHSTPDESAAIAKADAILADDGASDRWERRVAAYRDEKVDVTRFITDVLTEAAT